MYIRWRNRRNAKPGDGTSFSPGLKRARIDLKLSEQGNFEVGITIPVSELPNSIWVQKYIAAHCVSHAAHYFDNESQEIYLLSGQASMRCPPQNKNL